jgi:hypothetical protein
MLKRVPITLGASASLLLLAACSGGGSSTSTTSLPQVGQQSQARQVSSRFQVTPAMIEKMGLPKGSHSTMTFGKSYAPGRMSPYAKSNKNAIIYVSDFGTGTVDLFNATTLAPVGTISDGLSEPLGNAIDAAGNLYVANLGNNTVTVYPLGQTSPSLTYSTGLSGPIGVAVGADGTVYVSEYSAGEVVEYAKGQTSPTLTLTLSGGAEGVALDGKNNLYVSYNDANSGLGEVEEFAPGSSSGTNLGITVEFAGDIKVDKKGDILLEDQDAATINFYAPNSSSPYGSIAASGDTYKLALNKEECRVYLADFGTDVPIYTEKPNGVLVQDIFGLSASGGVSLYPAPKP